MLTMISKPTTVLLLAFYLAGNTNATVVALAHEWFHLMSSRAVGPQGAPVHSIEDLIAGGPAPSTAQAGHRRHHRPNDHNDTPAPVHDHRGLAEPHTHAPLVDALLELQAEPAGSSPAEDSVPTLNLRTLDPLIAAGAGFAAIDPDFIYCRLIRDERVMPVDAEPESPPPRALVPLNQVSV